MAIRIAIHVAKNQDHENILGSLGLLQLRWEPERNAYTALATHKAWTAVGQQTHVFPLKVFECLELEKAEKRYSASEATLRKFARAAAVADGNAFFEAASDPANFMEEQYLPEARNAVDVLEGLGIDPDAFAAMFPDPGAVFSRRVRYGDVRDGRGDVAGGNDATHLTDAQAA